MKFLGAVDFSGRGGRDVSRRVPTVFGQSAENFWLLVSPGVTLLKLRSPLHTTTRNTQRQRETETRRQRHRDRDRTQVLRTICTSDIFHDVRLKESLTFDNGFMFFFAPTLFFSNFFSTFFVSS